MANDLRPELRRASERLAIALMDVGAPKEMIADALRGRYGDFTSQSDTPIMDLVRDATRAGLTEIADRAKRGDFDGD